MEEPEDVTLTITDDDEAPQLNFGVSPATIAEHGGEAAITVSTADSTFATQQVITLTFAGAATKGTDYSVAAESLTLDIGEPSVSTTVTALGDATDESDEAILVTATHDGSTVGSQQQITIADTLAAKVSDHSSNVNEGDDAEFTVTLTGGTSTAAVEVNYAVDTSSTATSGDDYTAPSGKLTITAGASSGTITIETLTDQVLDPGETVVLKLTAARSGTRTVTVDATATKTTTIDDSGMATVSVGPAVVQSDDKSSVQEGETASFVVTLERRGIRHRERDLHDGERNGGVRNRQGLHDGERDAAVHDGTGQQDDRGDDAGGHAERGGRDLHVDVDGRDRGERSEPGHGERDRNDRGRRRADGGAGHSHRERGGRIRGDVRGGCERRLEHCGCGGELRGGHELDGDVGRRTTRRRAGS